MDYSEEFKSLLRETSEGYIGHGNPNAKILILGQEPAIDRNHEAYPGQYNMEIATNAQQWDELVANSIGSELVKPDTSGFGLPLHPWPIQKYQIQSGSEKKGNIRGNEGTARTWYKYQTIINLILGEQISKEDHLTFYRKSFHTDMSDESAKKHTDTSDSSAVSVERRIKLLEHPFFRTFPVVIAAVGNFPRDAYGDEYFGRVFGVQFIGNQSGESLPWLNVSMRDGDNPQLLIHCQQVSAPLRNAYFERIAEIVKDFADKYNIDLNPSR